MWEWIARAEVPPEGRVAALDGLDALTDPAEAGEWERVGASVGSATTTEGER